MNGALALAALEQAIERRHPQPKLVHHSDRGTQYASGDYVKRLESIGAVPSMSRAGRPWENGKCESFMKTLKEEEIHAREYASLEELTAHVEEFMEQIYNRQRLHSALGYRTPEEFEAAQAQVSNERPAGGWRPAAFCMPHYEEREPGKKR